MAIQPVSNDKGLKIEIPPKNSGFIDFFEKIIRKNPPTINQNLEDGRKWKRIKISDKSIENPSAMQVAEKKINELGNK